MQSCKLTAIIDTVEATKTLGKNNFTKRNLILVDDPTARFPNYALFEFVKDDVSLLDNLKKGQRVTVTFTPSARYWEPKNGKPGSWFSSCRASAISVESAAPDDDETQSAAPSAPNPNADLPF